MNKKYFTLLVSGILFFSQIAAIAAEDLVKFPDGNAAWTVDVTYLKTSPAVPEKANKVRVTQVGNMKRIEIAWSDGKTTERWAVPKLPVVFESDPRNGSVVPVESGSLRNKLFEFNLAYDQSAFDWINPQVLKKKEPVSYRGKKCFHYQGTVRFSIVILNNPEPQSVRQAWIDSETLLPVAVDTGTALCVFTFEKEPPTGPLVCPPKFIEAIAYYKKVMGLP